MTLPFPPALQIMIVGGLAWLLADNYPVYPIGAAIRFVTYGLAVAGVIIIAISIAAFIRERTTINPVKPEAANTLVVTGLYRFSRNPMYLGTTLLLVGWAGYLGDVIAVAPVVFYFVSMTVFQIKPEEKVLREKFGAQYDDYAKRVRRWI